MKTLNDRERRIYFATFYNDFEIVYENGKIYVSVKIGETTKTFNERYNIRQSSRGSGMYAFFESNLYQETLKFDDRIREVAIRNGYVVTPNKLTNSTREWVNHEFVYLDVTKYAKRFPKCFKKGNKKQLFKSGLIKRICENMFYRILKKYNNNKGAKLELRESQKLLLDDLNQKHKEGDLINIEAATRIGKTVTVLKFNYDNGYFPCWLGKEHTALASAIKDHNTFEEFKHKDFDALSLQQDTEKLIEKLKNKKNICLVIDEADSQSHTEKSIEKIIEICKNVDVQCVITMSATRSYRGKKILKSIVKGMKNIKEKMRLKIVNSNIPYHQIEHLDDVLKRDMVTINTFRSDAENYVNFSDSLSNEKLAKGTVEFFIKYCLSDEFHEVQEKSKDVYVYLGVDTNKKLKTFVKVLKRTLKERGEYNKYKIIEIHGELTSNKKAEIDVEKNRDPEKINIIVTNQMAATSFSVPSIGRTVVFGTEIDARRYQALHRSTTPNFLDENKRAQMYFITDAEYDTTKTNFMIDPLGFEVNVNGNDYTKEEKINIYKKFLSTSSLLYFYVESGKEIPINTNTSLSKFIDVQMASNNTLNNFYSLAERLNLSEIVKNVKGVSVPNKKSSATEKGKNVDDFGDEIDTKKKKTSKEESKDKKAENIAKELWRLGFLFVDSTQSNKLLNDDELLEKYLNYYSFITKDEFKEMMKTKELKENFTRHITLIEEDVNPKYKKEMESFVSELVF